MRYARAKPQVVMLKQAYSTLITKYFSNNEIKSIRKRKVTVQHNNMTILYSTPQYERSGGGKTISITVRTERMRCMAYFFFWTLCLFAAIISRIWVAPVIEAGAPEDTPIERLGCGAFNRQGGEFGLNYGEGFTFEETHLVETFGYGNICTLWDYTPAREAIGMYFPLFEYSLVMYLVLDFANTMLSYQRGELPGWYWTLIKIVTPINIILCIWFRMIFIFTAYDATQAHTCAFLGLQTALISVAITNTWYILLTGQSYPTLKLSKSQTAMIARIYLIFNLAISSVKIYATLHTVLSGIGPDFYKYPTFIPGMILGKLVDLIWMIMNAVIPLLIAYVRMSNEEPITIVLTGNTPIYEGARPQATETTKLVN